MTFAPDVTPDGRGNRHEFATTEIHSPAWSIVMREKVEADGFLAPARANEDGRPTVSVFGEKVDPEWLQVVRLLRENDSDKAVRRAGE